MTTIPATEVARLRNALPFWLSLGMVPLAVAGAWWGLGGDPAAGLFLGAVFDPRCPVGPE
jgi:hypothetical protein